MFVLKFGKRFLISAKNMCNASANERKWSLTDGEKIELIANSHSIERILKWARYFERIDGLQCLYCGSSLLYDFINGESFAEHTAKIV